MPNSSPQLADVITGALDARLSNVHTAIPCIVTEYDALRQVVSVQPAIDHPHYDEEGNRVVTRHPIVHDCPVGFMRSAGYAFTFPIAVGGYGLLLVPSCSVDKFYTLGGTVDPGDDRRFSLSDGVFYAGFYPDSEALDDVPTDAMVLYSPGEIRLGSADADDPVIRKSDLDKFIATYNAHTHAYSPGPGPSAPTAVPISTQTPISGSDKVKAD